MPRSRNRTSRGASRGHASQPGRPGKRPGADQSRQAGHAAGRRPRPAGYAAYEREPASRDYMLRLFAKHDFTLDDEEADRFWQYYLLLRQRNAELDLTRIVGIEATVLKHFIDSAIVAEMAELAGPLLDIGSGPGFPGVPIAIRRPGLEVILAESRGKRVRFLEELVSRLALKNVRIHARSVREDSPLAPLAAASATDLAAPNAAGPAGTMPVRSVITRALEAIPLTLARVQGFLPAGGKAIFLKGPNCGQEITAAQQQHKAAYKMVADTRYCLPNTGQQRRLVVFARRPLPISGRAV